MLEEKRMKICPNCGTSVADDMSFCNNCGASLTDVAVTADAAQNVTAQSTVSQSAPAGPISEPGSLEQGAATQNTPPQGSPTQGTPFQNNAQAPIPVPVMQQNYQQGPYGQPQGQPYMQQPYRVFDPKDHTAEFDPQDIADNKIFAVIPYMFSFVIGLIAGIYVSESRFLKFHIKNAVRLDVASVIAALLFVIPVLGWVAGGICLAILAIVKIVAIVYAFSGKAKELPIISSVKFLK